VPAQQLFDRLGVVFSDEPWVSIQAAGGWQPKVGGLIADLKAMVVHETSGWPPRANGRAMFRRAFLGAGTGLTTPLYVAGDGTVLQGMELPRRTGHAGFVNDRAFGSETGHPWGNYVGNFHLGPYSSSDDTMVPDPANPGQQIFGPTFGAVRPLHRRPGSGWLPMSGNDSIANPADDDLPGVKLWVQGLSGEIIVGWWTTARYAGPWRQEQRVPEALFTDAQYRAWARLSRWVAERWQLPRNVPLLPHKTRVPGAGVAGNLHGMLNDGASFAAIVLADEALSRRPQTFGLPPAPAPPAAADLQARYVAGAPAGATFNPHWDELFGTYRGFYGHGFPGDHINGDHDCPGPLFDWHRFARELWDWWWHPFDYDPANPNAPVAARAYSLDNRDGDTQLKEHYWSTPVNVPVGRQVEGIHGPHGSPRTFQLPVGSRIYAMAGGDAVAAWFPPPGAGVDLGLLVVRHEVYHQVEPQPPAPGGLPTRIDYDVAPTSVFSLYMHLARPDGIRFDAVDPANPEWLNRMLARFKECDLGTTFRQTAAGNGILQAVWDDRPPGGGPIIRPTVLEAWTLDQADYHATIQRLAAGQFTLFPGQRLVTPVKVLLGDYLGNAGIISHAAGGDRRGVRVEIFSNDVISRDFTKTVTDATRGWDPAVGPAGTRNAVVYPSEWSQAPTGAVRAALVAAGVADPDQTNWWETLQLGTNLRPDWPADALLVGGGGAVHYDPYEFLPWLNARTWNSEWPKYRAVDPAGVPAHPIPRP
jgi:hypothetical protein